MIKLGKEQPFERGESGSRSYLDHEATTSIGGGSSQLYIADLKESDFQNIDSINKVC